MFSHVYFGSNDIAKSTAFYDAAMGALGHARHPYPEGIIYPTADGALIVAPPRDGQPATAANGHTLGFTAKSHAEVDAFHAGGVAAGGTSDGEPGFRASSPGNMYGAYLRDPDGNKICAYAPHADAPAAGPDAPDLNQGT